MKNKAIIAKNIFINSNEFWTNFKCTLMPKYAQKYEI